MTDPLYVPTPRSVTELAQEISRQRRELKRMRSAQLSRSSVDDGALTTTVMGVDSNGDPIRLTTGQIGVQYDGTNGAVTLVGPTPPTPAAPVLTTVMGGVQVRVTGEWVQNPTTDPVVAPMDFARFEVHVSASVDFDPAGPNAFSTLKGTISSPRGGNIFVPWTPGATLLYARVVARSTPGKTSAPSQTAGPVPSGQVGLADLGFNIADYAGGNTIYFTTGADPVPPASGFAIGDLWLKQIGTSTGAAGQPAAGTPLYETYRWNTAWVRLEAQGVSSALANALAAQQAADSKAKVFVQSTAPTYTGAANTAIWVDTSAASGNVTKTWSGTAWVIRPLGNGAIAPNSLIASNVIATGTITAALLEATLILTTTLVSGNPGGTHSRVTPTGIYVYAADPVDNVPNEVIRVGTASNDYFGITSSTGELLASLDDTGAVNARIGNFRDDIRVKGTALTDLISPASGSRIVPGASNYYSYVPGSQLDAVTTEIGLHEMSIYLQAGRNYLLMPEITFSTVGSAELQARVRVASPGQGAPTVTSSEAMYRQTHAGKDSFDTTWQSVGNYRAAVSGLHRFLLTAARGGAGTLTVSALNNRTLPALTVLDLGPGLQNLGSVNRGGGGGSVPVPTQQYDTGNMTIAGHVTYTGSWAVRTDTDDVIQGWDPTGANGDGIGYWWWNMPSITGTVDRVDVYLFANHWYYNSGGTAIINMVPSNLGGAGFTRASAANLLVPGWPKPGAQWVTLPSGWLPYFRNAGAGGYGQINGISIGNAGGTDLTYYGRFSGPGALMRIWYTQ